MTKQTVILHPHIKATLKNLDLDLVSELNRYEQYLNSLEHESATQPQEAIPALESLVNLSQQNDDSLANTIPTLFYESAIINTDKEEIETIPVASRIVTQPKSLPDTLLTPWGIFGLIFFFASNALIFVNLDFNQQKANNLTVNNDTPLDNSHLKQLKINQSETTNNNQPNQPLNQPLNQPPSPPSPLPTIQTPEVIKTTQPSRLYPDLKTALLTEAKNYQPQLPPPPSSPMPVNQYSVTTPQTQNQTTTASKASAKPQPQTKYYVVTDYQDMQNYSQVKEVIAEALITNLEDEMKIQLGVFNDKSDAEKHRQKIQKQGLESQIISVSQ